MASRRATWIAFRLIARRSLNTFALTRSSPRHQLFHPPHQTLASTAAAHGRRLPRHHFTSNSILKHNDAATGAKEKPAKRKAARTSQASSTSLRRVAAEAQRSRNLIKGTGKRKHVDPEADTKDVTAYCGADTYNIHVATHLLRRQGYGPDPLHTGLFPQVLHIQIPNYLVKNEAFGGRKAQGVGDVFVFPSGTVVTWNVPQKVAHHIVERVLPDAAENGHLEKMEAEDLEFLEDPTRETSMIVGDTIILGTKTSEEHDPASKDLESGQQRHEVDTILAKIAFSSALARSTKLAVLENSLNHYFTTTRSIPATLSAGSQLRFTRAFILRKTGELLSIRAQLNLYSELTDSLPDLFWDSPYELGLESYYEMVGKALDVGVRIKVLNEKMDYASEIAAVLRERLSEKHSTFLEWLIIGLITIEVVFSLFHLWQEREERLNPDSTKALLHEFLLREREMAKKLEGKA